MKELVIDFTAWTVRIDKLTINTPEDVGDHGSGSVGLTAVLDQKLYGPFEIPFRMTSGGCYLDGDPVEVFFRSKHKLNVEVNVAEFSEFVNTIIRRFIGAQGAMFGFTKEWTNLSFERMNFAFNPSDLPTVSIHAQAKATRNPMGW